MNKDDLIRREVIENILCLGNVAFEPIEDKYQINFKDYFEREVSSLEHFLKDDIIEYTPEEIKITELGSIFKRHVSRVFDNFLAGGKAYQIHGSGNKNHI